MSIMTSKKIYRETGTCPICHNTKGMYEQIKKLQKQSDMLTLGILQEKDKVAILEQALDYAKKFIDGLGKARNKEKLGRNGMDAVLKEIDKIVNPTDTCPICGDEKLIDDLHRNCGK